MNAQGRSRHRSSSHAHRYEVRLSALVFGPDVNVRREDGTVQEVSVEFSATRTITLPFVPVKGMTLDGLHAEYDGGIWAEIDSVQWNVRDERFDVFLSDINLNEAAAAVDEATVLRLAKWYESFGFEVDDSCIHAGKWISP